jgi:hypothetical protein
MADLQKHFEQFHNAIRVDFDSQSTLREKRDIVLEKIAKSLKKNGRPSFERLLQGSYKMKTGVLPLGEEEFDIDVGLVFDFEDHRPETEEVRGWVMDAIGEHTDKVAEKTPCIRVHYKDSPPYHLDLVVYGRLSGELQLATKSAWIDADPEQLLGHVASAYAQYGGTEGNTGIDQFRRTVRYLKRWGDVRSPGDAKGKPTGLAYTLLASKELACTQAFDGTPDDATALSNMTESASKSFRISAKKPTPEYEDMFERLDNSQMELFKRDLKTLADTIRAAQDEPDPHDACSLLVAVLGTDFPVPPKGSGGKRTSSPAIVPSSSSA